MNKNKQAVSKTESLFVPFRLRDPSKFCSVSPRCCCSVSPRCCYHGPCKFCSVSAPRPFRFASLLLLSPYKFCSVSPRCCFFVFFLFASLRLVRFVTFHRKTNSVSQHAKIIMNNATGRLARTKMRPITDASCRYVLAGNAHRQRYSSGERPEKSKRDQYRSYARHSHCQRQRSRCFHMPSLTALLLLSLQRLLFRSLLRCPPSSTLQSRDLLLTQFFLTIKLPLLLHE